MANSNDCVLATTDRGLQATNLWTKGCYCISPLTLEMQCVLNRVAVNGDSMLAGMHRETW